MCNCQSYIGGGDCIHTVSPEDFYPTPEEMIALGWEMKDGMWVRPADEKQCAQPTNSYFDKVPDPDTDWLF